MNSYKSKNIFRALGYIYVMIDDLRESDEWKIQLIMIITFMSIKHIGDK